MTERQPRRRDFLAGMGLASAAVLCGRSVAAPQASSGRLHVSINQWSVGATRKRDLQHANVTFDAELAGLANCGIDGLEPGLHDAPQAAAMAAQLGGHGLQMRSIYAGSQLLDRAKNGDEIRRIVELGKRARTLGVKIIVTNPSPLPKRPAARIESQPYGRLV